MSRRRRLFRDDQGPAAGPGALAYAALYVACIAVSTATASASGTTVFWPANGVLAAAILTLPRGPALRLTLVCLAINLANTMWRGTPAGLAAAYVVLNALEVAVTVVIARRVCGAALDMRRPGRLLRFLLLAAAPAAALSAAIGAAITPLPADLRWTAFGTWFAADSLGLMIVAPSLMLFARRRRFADLHRLRPLHALGVTAVVIAVAVAVFAQPSAAFLVLIIPPLLFAALRLPPHWVAAVVVAVAAVAVGATVADFGPFDVSRPRQPSGRVPFDAVSLLTLQMFLAVVLLTALPASAVVTERLLLARRAAERSRAASEARRRAEHAYAAKGRFLSGMSHEMRTPLNGVAGYTALLAARDDLPEEARRHVAALQRSGADMLALVEELLNAARGVSDGDAVPPPELVTPDAPAAAEPATADDGRSPRILIVDDHPVNREVARLLLAAAGCETVEACDGEEAVEAARAEAFDLILMDVRMPRMDGLEATCVIRALPGDAAATPIVALTADAMPEDVARCLAAGMDEVLAKPIDQGRLYAAVNRALQGRAEGEQAAA